ncbi:unnamed protein product, partial [Phaeothamnion confervicola]
MRLFCGSLALPLAALTFSSASPCRLSCNACKRLSLLHVAVSQGRPSFQANERQTVVGGRLAVNRGRPILYLKGLRGGGALVSARAQPTPFVELGDSQGSHPCADRGLQRTLANAASYAADCFRPRSHRGTVAVAEDRDGGDTVALRDLQRLAGACRGESVVVALSVATLVSAALCEIAVPHYSAVALHVAAHGRDGAAFAAAIQGLCALGVVSAGLTGLRTACFGLAATRVVTRLRHSLFQSLLCQEIGFFDGIESGELANRLSSDCSKLWSVVAFNSNVLARQGIQCVGGLVVMFRISRPLAAVASALVAAILAVTLAHGHFQRRMGERIQDALAAAAAFAQQSFSSARLVRSFAAEPERLVGYSTRLAVTLEAMEAHDVAFGVYRVAVRLLQTALQVAALVGGWLFLRSGMLTSRDMMSFSFYVGFVLSAAYDCGDQWTKIQDALGSAREVFALIDREPAMHVLPISVAAGPPLLRNEARERGVAVGLQGAEGSGGGRGGSNGVDGSNGISDGLESNQGGSGIETDVAIGGGDDSGDVPGGFSLEDVTFSYPMRPNVAAVAGLSLHVPEGARVALVGPSGGGKSTVLRLLSRFYDPQQGAVLLGGRDLRSFGSRELSDAVAWVSQDTEILPMSVADNICLGLPRLPS